MGDAWEIDLTGAPYAEIYINGSDTGAAIGSGGTQSFSGTIPEGSEGLNEQYWTVGGADASPYPLSFTVLAAPSGTCLDAVSSSFPVSELHTTDSFNWNWNFPSSSYISSDHNGVDTLTGTVSLSSSPTTYCTVESTDANLTGDPETPFLTAWGSVSGTTVSFTLADAGCQGDYELPRACDIYDRSIVLNDDPGWVDYPIYQYMVTRVWYYDQYYRTLYPVENDFDLWVDTDE